MERVCHTQLKSVEFVFYSKEIVEIFDVHTDFTAGRMLHLYRSIPPNCAFFIMFDPNSKSFFACGGQTQIWDPNMALWASIA